MSELKQPAQPAASGKNIKFKPGVTAANIPGFKAVGTINETHLASASIIKLIGRARENNAKWFNDHFVEQ